MTIPLQGQGVMSDSLAYGLRLIRRKVPSNVKCLVVIYRFFIYN